MKTARLLAAAFVACASLPLTMAQQVNATAQENASASAASVHENESANANANANARHGRADANGSAENSLIAKGEGRGDVSASGSAVSAAQMRPVTGQLEGKLDSKTAKPGDQVFLKTTEKTKTADGMVIPKGARLVGHVTEVQEHAKGRQESHLGLEFDRVELKNGQSMAIHSLIESVQPSAAAMAAGSMDDDAMLSAPMGGGNAMVGGASRTGGGLLGGAGSAVGAVGHAGSGLESTTAGSVGATGNVAGNAAGSVGHGLNAGTEGAGSLGARATGLPGVMLSGDAVGSASGVLSATNRNIHLDSGTQMVVGVAAAR